MKTTRWLLLCLALMALPALAGMISTAQEIQIGREASLKFEQQYGLVQDVAMQERVNRIGQSLAAVAARKDVQYTFKVANMDQFNALAFPGGFIYTTRGLMNALSDEELAFVLGHEVTHVVRRHSVNQLEKAVYTQTGLLAIIGVLNNGQIDQGSANLAKLANAVMSSQWSQADEREADHDGIQLMAAAGYDPVYAVSALVKLSKQSGGTPGFLNTLVGSHPLPQDRIKAATAEVPGVPYQVTAAPVAPAIPAGPLFAGARVDSSWEQDLLETLNLAQSGLSRDNRLQNEARRLAVSRQSEHVHAGRAQLIIDIPAPASSVQGESMLIGDRLPEVLAQYRFSRYGLSVGKTRSGLRQIVMLLE
ncbi:MAG: M48 family metalloprotease [Candidatus Eremiobacteraeota bacterium]|nr:M48 family metalloprotease [Candidatus Eremiobacteraeota bacterium]